MRALFVCGPGEGHLNPVVPLLWALRGAGHEVLVGAPENMHAGVIAAGLPVVATAGELDLMKIVHGAPKDAGEIAMAPEETGHGFAKVCAQAFDGAEAVVRRGEPDQGIAEPTAVEGLLAGAVHGVPVVESRWGLGWPAAARAAALGDMAPLWERHGLTAQPEPQLVLDVCPPSYEPTRSAGELRMAYVPYNGAGWVADWLLTRPDKPRVCVTLGTVLPQYGWTGSLLDEVVEGVRTAAADIVVAISDEHLAALDPAPVFPAEVSFVGRVPLDQLLPTCAAVVHHGGSGSTFTSLVHGVPQVVLPHFADQFANAKRLANLGAGIRIDSEELSAARVQVAVKDVLNDDSYRRSARLLSDEIARQPRPSEVVRVLERLVTRPRRGAERTPPLPSAK